MTASTLGLAHLTNEIVRLEQERQRATEAHANEDAAFRRKIEEVQHRRDLAGNGVPPEVTELALTVVYVRGTPTTPTRRLKVEQAIRDLADGPTKLRRDYFGTKNYDGWTDQATDCEYGRSPSHGSIVFQVGLTEEVRNRGLGLTAEEREAAICYLMGLLR